MGTLASMDEGRELMGTANRLQQILYNLNQPPLPEDQSQAFASYMGLLLRWNERINLTSIRDEEGILRRHFAESIIAARLLPVEIKSLLDYGSGGGFPGIPCAICRPELHVTLAESQTKKAAFLRETVRTLDLEATVYASRVDSMGTHVRFDGVILRAVDHMMQACQDAAGRVRVGGWLIVMSTHHGVRAARAKLIKIDWRTAVPLEGSDQAMILIGERTKA